MEFLPALRCGHPLDCHIGAAFIDTLGDVLAADGLFVRRYRYGGDPRICIDPADGRRLGLADLAGRFQERRLLLVGNGEELIDPQTGDLAPWTDGFKSWQDRAILTPVTARQWSMREAVLARLFVVLPATLAGLAAVQQGFAGTQENSLKSWVKNDSSPTVPLRPGENLARLRAYLGQSGFDWLCVCDVYPELNWGLTLQVGLLTRSL